jgi:hypothetical protein
MKSFPIPPILSLILSFATVLAHPISLRSASATPIIMLSLGSLNSPNPLVESVCQIKDIDSGDVSEAGDCQSSFIHESENEVCMTGSKSIPTFFENMKRSYTQVSLGKDGAISTVEFLDATESILSIFDVLGSLSFGIVKSDINGNVLRIRTKYLENPAKYSALQSIVLAEATMIGGKREATQGLLWLRRSLEFVAVSLRRNTKYPEELSVSMYEAYKTTLGLHLDRMLKPFFWASHIYYLTL